VAAFRVFKERNAANEIKYDPPRNSWSMPPR
jgi:hypothetical protein